MLFRFVAGNTFKHALDYGKKYKTWSYSNH